jgi:hypothetical protein
MRSEGKLQKQINKNFGPATEFSRIYDTTFLCPPYRRRCRRRRRRRRLSV